jgi:hypothetical protein
MKHFLTTLLIVFASSLYGQVSTSKHYLSLELDPAPYILGGYSLSIKYSMKSAPRLAIMGSVFSSSFPEAMMLPENSEKGWSEMKFETSYAIFTDFYLNVERKGFYVGPSVFLYNKSASLRYYDERVTFSTLFPNVRIGYVWYPFKKIQLYCNPWINVGSEISIDNKNQLNGISFDLNKFNYIVAIHVGYSINL